MFLAKKHLFGSLVGIFSIACCAMAFSTVRADIVKLETPDNYYGLDGDTLIDTDRDPQGGIRSYSNLSINNNHTLTIAKGGVVKTGSFGGGLMVGSANSSPGKLVVDGGTLTDQNNIYIGHYKNSGVAVVQNGGTVTAQNGIYVGNQVESAGTVELKGGGSSISTALVSVGNANLQGGQATITISDGALWSVKTDQGMGTFFMHNTEGANTINLVTNDLFGGPLLDVNRMQFDGGPDNLINLGFDFSTMTVDDWAGITDGYHLKLAAFDSLWVDISKNGGYQLNLLDGIGLMDGWSVTAEYVYQVNDKGDTLWGDQSFGLTFNKSASAVPEPGTMLILGLSVLVGVPAYRRMRKNRQN